LTGNYFKKNIDILILFGVIKVNDVVEGLHILDQTLCLVCEDFYLAIDSTFYRVIRFNRQKLKEFNQHLGIRCKSVTVPPL